MTQTFIEIDPKWLEAQRVCSSDIYRGHMSLVLCSLVLCMRSKLRIQRSRSHTCNYVAEITWHITWYSTVADTAWWAIALTSEQRAPVHQQNKTTIDNNTNVDPSFQSNTAYAVTLVLILLEDEEHEALDKLEEEGSIELKHIVIWLKLLCGKAPGCG